MTKRVLADFHHGDLYESLRILFEDRFGWELYRPVGLDWYRENYWMVYDHIDTAGQYLDVHKTSPPRTIHGEDVTKVHGDNAWLNKYSEDKGNGYYLVYDQNHGGRIHRGILLEAAKRDGFDYIISSMPAHYERFERLLKVLPGGCKHICQIGNIGWRIPSSAKFVLNSTTTPCPSHIPCVYYHQEFSLKEFSPDPYPENVRSLTNLMHYQEFHYKNDFIKLTSALKERGWTIKDYGAGNEDGACLDIAQAIHDTGFVWHCKKGGDGYGHNIFNSFAAGRPMVVNTKDYINTIAGRLFFPGDTVIDMAKLSTDEAVQRLEAAAEDYSAMRQRVIKQFNDEVDFDRESASIRSFFEHVVDSNK